MIYGAPEVRAHRDEQAIDKAYFTMDAANVALTELEARGLVVVPGSNGKRFTIEEIVRSYKREKK